MPQRIKKGVKLRSRVFKSLKSYGPFTMFRSVLGFRRIAKLTVCFILAGVLGGLFSSYSQTIFTAALTETLPAENTECGGGELATSGPVHKIVLNNYGSISQFCSSAERVSDVLFQNNILVSFNAGVYPDPSSSINSDTNIFVGTISVRSERYESVSKFKEVEISDSSLPKGTRLGVQRGIDGLSDITFLIQLIAGQEISRTILSEEVIEPKIDQVFYVGTMELPDPNSIIYTTDEARAFAKAEMENYGWDFAEFTCLNQLWQRESGWNAHAMNGASGAYGIPQSLPGSKMAAYGGDWMNNAETQITWGLHYIQDRYATPCGAWTHSNMFNWY